MIWQWKASACVGDAQLLGCYTDPSSGQATSRNISELWLIDIID
jgi:hypothetical protein